MAFPFPSYLQLYPTMRCNQECIFCFNDKSLVKSKRQSQEEDTICSDSGFSNDMSYENALKLLDVLLENNIRELDIMGGEPLLLMWMADFIRKAVALEIKVNISTNGSLTGPLKEIGGIDSPLLDIGLSLEASTGELHNYLTKSRAFSTVISNIEYLVKAGRNPIVKTVLNRRNMRDIDEIVGLLRGLGVKRYYLIHMDCMPENAFLSETALSYVEFQDISAQVMRANKDMAIDTVSASCFDKKKLPAGVRCAGGVRKLAVMPDGSVFPCNLLHHFSEYNLGNIFESPLATIWENNKLAAFRHAGVNNCPKEDCVNRDNCTGACPAHSYYYFWDTEIKDIRCVR